MSAAWSWPPTAAEQADRLAEAADILREGGILPLPTESGELQVALSESAAPPGATGGPIRLLRMADELRECVPDLGLVGRRLARRCWPGPLQLECDLGDRTGRFAMPAHPAAAIARMVDSPLWAWEVGPADQESATVVGLCGSRWSVQRAGRIDESELRRQSIALVLFVCTGNTCRSPLAEAIARRLLADRLGAPPDRLVDRGLWLASAGLAAWPGEPASAETVALAREFDIDLSGHASRPASANWLAHADLIFAMTRSHRAMIEALVPEAAERTELLCGDAGDLPDPIGGGPEVYQACAAVVRAAVERSADRILAQIAPAPTSVTGS